MSGRGFTRSISRGLYNILIKEIKMAKNKPYGDDHRQGAVKERSQVHNPHNERWTKRDIETGEFIDQKADEKPFKGVRKEK